MLVLDEIELLPPSVLVETAFQKKVDAMQYAMEQMPQTECPITNRFTPGLYIRECFVPKGTLIVSKIHKTEHPYIISKGDISVWIEGVGAVRLKAPHTGVTKPGTRRVLFAHEDTIWTTFHPSDETDLEKLEALLIEPRDVELSLTGEIKTCLGLPQE